MCVLPFTFSVILLIHPSLCCWHPGIDRIISLDECRLQRWCCFWPPKETSYTPGKENFRCHCPLPDGDFWRPGWRCRQRPPPLRSKSLPGEVKLAYRTTGKDRPEGDLAVFRVHDHFRRSVIEHAADLGIIHFDTARVYQNGNNERMVGAALKGRRKQVVISSKTLGKTRQEALADLDTSLRELGTDYLDIWYLHNRNTPPR